MEPSWKKMFLFSFLIHLGVFSLVFFVPESAPTRSLKGVIYEVDLVELPVRRPARATGSRKAVAKKGVPIHKKRRTIKRIGRLKSKEKPIVIAKKVVRRKRKKTKRISPSPDKVLEQALAKVEKTLEKKEREKKETNRVEEAISRIKEQVGKEESPKGPMGRRGAAPGITLQIYKVEVESRIKSNWSYPAVIADPSKREELEAIVVLRVRRDGRISESRFKKRSGDAMFDESVMRAIERSDPLPPFPEGFLKSFEEIEINFNLRELETV